MKKAILDAGENGSRIQHLVRLGLKVTGPGRLYYLERHIRKSKKKGFKAIGDGFVKFVKETVCDDVPGTADLYHAGQSKGKREGFADASELFGKEIRKLGEQLVALKKGYNEFSKQQKDVYGKVIAAYDDELQRMTNKCDKSEEENQYLRKLLREKQDLLRIKA